jgi:hypothetical protein
MKHSRWQNEVILFSGLEQTCYLLTKLSPSAGRPQFFRAIFC